VTDLPYGLTTEALGAAEAEADPSSLAAAGRLRARFGADLAAAAVSQVVLRRRARTKFGDAAASMFFTRDGLEQATRPEVAAYHARHFLEAGASRVVDLGCGIGADALAFAAAGLEVTAVEIDPVAAVAARANLSILLSAGISGAGPVPGQPEVVVGDAEEIAERLLRPGDAAFCDPARRTAAGRVWRVEDFRPSWEFVRSLLDGTRTSAVKLGPALPHGLIPAGVHAEWVSHSGEVVEVFLTCGPTATGGRSALVWPDHRLEVPPQAPELPLSAPLRYLHEPDGAVIRAGGVQVVGDLLGAALLDPKLAYLTSDELVATPYATAFRVLEILPYKERLLRQWVKERRVGTLEIKKRGLEVDPAELRRRLRPQGPGRATIILSRTVAGAKAIVAERVLTVTKP
jgi:SAM-dependent methyltransferase